MTREERKLALYCLKASSDYHSEVCEECINYPNCDHTIQDDVTETIIKALEQEPKILNTLDFAIDASNGDTNYFVGFRNGLRYAKSLIDGEEEPPFESCTEPRTGHWIKTPKAVMGEGYMWYCDKCEYEVYQDSSRPYPSEKYCPNCGCRMVEPQGRRGEEMQIVIKIPEDVYTRLFDNGIQDNEIATDDICEMARAIRLGTPLLKCKDCKYFEYDSVAKVDGVPLIVAHEICNKWGDGCKTREDGYCFLFEPKESEG